MRLSPTQNRSAGWAESSPAPPAPFVERRSAERRRTQIELRKQLASNLRQELARELHDSVVQSLTSSLMTLQVVIQSRQQEEPGLAADLAVARDSIRESLISLRRIISDARTGARKAPPVATQVRRLLRKLFPARSGVEARLDLDPAWMDPDPVVTLLLFRIVEEALINVRRHSQAGSVVVRLGHVKSGLEITVSDDGIGPGPAADLEPRLRGQGTIGMYERAALAGGRLTVRAGRSGGTLVRLWLGKDSE